jgi:hypothetical protein
VLYVHYDECKSFSNNQSHFVSLSNWYRIKTSSKNVSKISNLSIPRNLVVNDMINVWNIHSSCHDISRNQNTIGSCAKSEPKITSEYWMTTLHLLAFEGIK